MIKKSDFIWHVGFQGNAMVVNRREKLSIRTLDPIELLRASRLRAAFCSAIWEHEVERKAGGMDKFLGTFQEMTGLTPKIDDLQRMMGVYYIPQGNINIINV